MLELEQRALLIKEIAALVADAKRDGRLISTDVHAARLLAAYPDANFSVGRIVDEIILAASALGIAVEMARPSDKNEKAAEPHP